VAGWQRGVVAWWRGGVVAWWRGGVVAWWRGGVVAAELPRAPSRRGGDTERGLVRQGRSSGVREPDPRRAARTRGPGAAIRRGGPGPRRARTDAGTGACPRRRDLSRRSQVRRVAAGTGHRGTHDCLRCRHPTRRSQVRRVAAGTGHRGTHDCLRRRHPTRRSQVRGVTAPTRAPSDSRQRRHPYAKDPGPRCHCTDAGTEARP
jgi:hypothetical protein